MIWDQSKETATPGSGTATAHKLRPKSLGPDAVKGSETACESLPMIEKLLGHAQVQTMARYRSLAARDSAKASASKIADLSVQMFRLKNPAKIPHERIGRARRTPRPHLPPPAVYGEGRAEA